MFKINDHVEVIADNMKYKINRVSTGIIINIYITDGVERCDIDFDDDHVVRNLPTSDIQLIEG